MITAAAGRPTPRTPTESTTAAAGPTKSAKSRTPGPVPNRRMAVRCAAVVLEAISVGLCFARAFPSEALIRPVLIAAVVPVAATVLLGLTWRTLRRWGDRPPTWAALLVCALLWYPVGWAALMLSPAAVPGRMEPMVGALLNAPVRILESTLPVRPTPDLVVLPFTVVWLVSAVGVVLVWRGSGALVPAGPALFALVGAVLLAVPRPGHAPAVLGVVVAAGLFVLADDTERIWSRPTAISALLTLGLACAGGLAVGLLPCWAGTPVIDPRDHVSQPPHRWSEISPLSRVGGWLIEPERPMFEASRVDGTPIQATTGIVRWRLAVLDRYDGRIWTTSARPTPAGLEVPRRPPPPGPRGGLARPDARLGAVERDRVDLRELTGSFLPTREELVGLDGPDLSVDIPTGSLVSRASAATGAAYELTIRPLAAPRDEFLATLPAVAPVPGEYPAPPEDLQAEISGVARNIRASAIGGHAQASVLALYLSSELTLDVTAPGGHSQGDVDSFLRRERAGTPEQFAAAFAAVAHELGLRVRIVVGFDSPAGADPVVRAGSATAWPEVEFETAGWVAYAPTPSGDTSRLADEADTGSGRGGDRQTSGADAGSDEEQGLGPDGEPGDSAQNPPNPQLDTKIPPPQPDSLPPQPEGIGRIVLTAALAAVAAAALSYVGAVLTVPRMVRASWRANRSSRRQVIGAWNDLILELRDSGVTVPAAATRTRIVDIAATRLTNSDSARRLSDLAAQALYGRDLPWGDTGTDAWHQADLFRRQVRAARSWHTRLADRIHPRRLRRPDLENGGWLGPLDLLQLTPIVRWWAGTGVWTRRG